MSLKRKIALNLSIAFSLLFGIVMAVIYMSFNDFRKDEFKERFRQRLEFTSHFIAKSKDFEEEAPVFFNENSDNILLNETILIFNGKKELIYSTIKDRNVTWDSALLKELDDKKVIYSEKTVPEIYAALRKINGENYYILTSAFDTNGESKLAYLKYLLITAYVMSALLIGFFSYYFMGQFLRPFEAQEGAAYHQQWNDQPGCEGRDQQRGRHQDRLVPQRPLGHGEHHRQFARRVDPGYLLGVEREVVAEHARGLLGRDLGHQRDVVEDSGDIVE